MKNCNYHVYMASYKYFRLLNRHIDFPILVDVAKYLESWKSRINITLAKPYTEFKRL